jgi:uncharacterized repeat protein (TIGR03837 family)
MAARKVCDSALMRPLIPMLPQWDIFCRVIDNFGDIGVSLRLARILSDNLGQPVRLWVDNLQALAKLDPAFFARHRPADQTGMQANIEVIPWTNPAPHILPAPFVIEAFGCALPLDYQARMPGRTVAWFNLEYFSAEAWVEGCHALYSPAANGLAKQFVFPSTLPTAGGLCETTLHRARDQFMHDADERARWSAQWQVPLPQPQGLSILLFGYENAALMALIGELQAPKTSPVTLYIPEGRLLTSLSTAFNGIELNAGQTLQQGNLTLHILPFLPQTQFDRLLWLCDINFVRGEDSLVRALWAGKPLVWQIYPTDDNAHWAKLNALLDSISNGLSCESRAAWHRINHAWNQQILSPNDWQTFVSMLPELSPHAEHTRQRLAQQPELARWLVKTAFERLQCATN